MKKYILGLLVVSLFAGCAHVPMEDRALSDSLKEFKAPPEDKSGLYIYRDSTFGAALKKNLYVDNEFIGQSAPLTYFYKQLVPGEHRVETESEFSNNGLNLTTQGGKNYFVRQYIKMGVFVGGANVEQVSEDKARQDMKDVHLAAPLGVKKQSEPKVALPQPAQ